MPSKILIVTDYGTLSGGAELISHNLREELRRRGHDARLFSSTARPLPLPIESDYQCFGTTSRWRTLLQSANPWAALSLSRVLAAFNPDIVHVRLFLTQLSPLILPLLRSRPSLLHLETYHSICPIGTKLLPDSRQCTQPRGLVCWRCGCLPLRDWIPLSAQRAMTDRYQEVFDTVITNSHWMRRQAEAAGMAVDEVVWNGVDVPDVVAEPTDGPTIAFAGRLVEEKGVDVLLRAMATVVDSIVNVRLMIVGDGPIRADLATLAERLGIGSRIELTGHLGLAESQECLAGTWVQAVPSIWAEPFGLVTVEAMARGSCVIATDIGGSAELVRHEHNGLLVPPNETGALAAALLRLLGDETLRATLRENGRRFVRERASMTAFVDAIESLYERTLSVQSRSKA